MKAENIYTSIIIIMINSVSYKQSKNIKTKYPQEQNMTNAANQVSKIYNNNNPPPYKYAFKRTSNWANSVADRFVIIIDSTGQNTQVRQRVSGGEEADW